MIGYNDNDMLRVRYCFAESFLDAANKFNTEYWYLRIKEITECQTSEASVIGAMNYSVG